MKGADVSVVIPNWNGARWLPSLFESLSRQTVRPREVIVVDNASTDDSRSFAGLHGAVVIALDRNFGFARAVNDGIRSASGRWVAILNNDVELDADWLDNLLSSSEREDALFAVGRVCRMDDPSRLDGTFDLVSRSGCAWRAGHGAPDGPAWDVPRRIQFVPLTAAVIRRDLFRQVGLLDEAFGSYLEDVEFGLRCAAEGVEGIYVPSARARHRGSATLGSWSPAMVRLISRNQMFLVARHWPGGLFGPFFWEIVAGQLLWGWLALQRGTGSAWLRGKWEGLRWFSSLRRPDLDENSERMEQILANSERQIRSLLPLCPESRFWNFYFRLVG